MFEPILKFLILLKLTTYTRILNRSQWAVDLADVLLQGLNSAE